MTDKQEDTDLEEEIICRIEFSASDDVVLVTGELHDGSGLCTQGSSLYEALGRLKEVLQLYEPDIEAKFGPGVLRGGESFDEAELHSARDSLSDYLSGAEDVLDVGTSATVLLVHMKNDTEYAGPWSWNGFDVIASYSSDI